MAIEFNVAPSQISKWAKELKDKVFFSKDKNNFYNVDQRRKTMEQKFLEHEMENYKKEQEKIKKLIGSIGATHSSRNHKIFNGLFLTLVVFSFFDRSCRIVKNVFS